MPVEAATPSSIATPPIPAGFTEQSPSQPPATERREPSAAPMDDAFKDLDGYSNKPVEKKTPPQQKPEEPKALGEPEVPELKPDEQKQQDQQKPVPKTDVKTLRNAYDGLKKENGTLKAELEQLKKQAPPSPQEHPEWKTLRERYDSSEKRRTELEDEIRFASYERSQDYAEKYQKPFEQAYEYGKQSVSRLRVNTEDGQVRQATEEDFNKILMMQDEDAADLAEKMFGNKDKIVLQHRWELRKLDAARYQAIQDFKKVGGERETKLRESETRRNEEMGKMWKQLNGEAQERFPKWFKSEEGDEEGNKLLEEGYKLADSAFSQANGLSPEAMVRLHASIRNRAAAFTREVYRNRKLETKIEELTKELEDYKSSEPGPGDVTVGKPAVDTDWEGMLLADA